MPAVGVADLDGHRGVSARGHSIGGLVTELIGAKEVIVGV